MPLWVKEIQLKLFPSNLSHRLKRLSRRKNYCTLWTNPKLKVRNHNLSNFTMLTHFWRVVLHTWFFWMVFIQRLQETSLYLMKIRIIIQISNQTLKSVSLSLNCASCLNKSRVNFCNRTLTIRSYPTSKVVITLKVNARTVCRVGIRQHFVDSHLRKLSLCAWFAESMGT